MSIIFPAMGILGLGVCMLLGNLLPCSKNDPLTFFTVWAGIIMICALTVIITVTVKWTLLQVGLP